jgi:hypothetical protein
VLQPFDSQIPGIKNSARAHLTKMPQRASDLCNAMFAVSQILPPEVWFQAIPDFREPPKRTRTLSARP